MSEVQGGAEVRQPDELVFEFDTPLIYLTSKAFTSKAFTPNEARRLRDDLTDAIAW